MLVLLCQMSGIRFYHLLDSGYQKLWLEHFRPSLRFPRKESRFFCCMMLSVLLLYRRTPYYPYILLFETGPEYGIPQPTTNPHFL